MTVPGGIHLCQLPFVDDVRAHDLSSTVSIVHPPGELRFLYISFLEVWAIPRLMRFAAVLSLRQDPETGEESEQPEIDAAKKIIKHYSRTFNPEMYPNPGELAAPCLSPSSSNRTRTAFLTDLFFVRRKRSTTSTT